MPAALNGLLRSELKQCIYEANLSKSDALIAERYYIERVPQIDIAAELEFERATISRRLKRIAPRVERAAVKLGLTAELSRIP